LKQHGFLVKKNIQLKKNREGLIGEPPLAKKITKTTTPLYFRRKRNNANLGTNSERGKKKKGERGLNTGEKGPSRNQAAKQKTGLWVKKRRQFLGKKSTQGKKGLETWGYDPRGLLKNELVQGGECMTTPTKGHGEKEDGLRPQEKKKKKKKCSGGSW